MDPEGRPNTPVEVDDEDEIPPARRLRTLAALPSILTLGNGAAGFAAVVMMVKSYAHTQAGAHAHAAEAMLEASIYIGVAMVCDVLDGKVARVTGSSGRFGAELDSLCDAVSFGLAPALMLRVFGEALFGSGIDAAASFQIRVLWSVSVLYLGCTVLRLARFNVETSETDPHRTFSGLPSPAAAAAVVSLFLLSWQFRDPATGALGLKDQMSMLLPILGTLFAVLMVSRIPYPHLFNRIFGGGATLWTMVAVLGVVSAFGLLGANAIPGVIAVAMLTYVSLGVLGSLRRLLMSGLKIGRRGSRT